MQPWLIQLILNCQGEVIENYDQADDTRRGLHHRGWCNGCVTHWLRCKRFQIDFWSWFRTGEAATRVRSVMTKAKMIKSAVPNHPDPSTEAATLVLKEYGIILSYYGEEMVLRGKTLSTEISANHGGGKYNFVAMWGAGGGHVFGVVWGEASCSIFDPNAGEIVIPRNRTTDFFPMFLTGMGYSRDYSGCGVVKFS